MTDQPTPCRSTQHCATHDFCHRCAPDLAKASRHLVKVMDAAKIDTKRQGAVYAQLAATVRDAARQTGQQPDPAAEETHVVTDDSDDPEHTDDCPGCLPECAQCDDTGACNGGPCAHPAAGLDASQPATEAHPADVTLIVERRGATDWLMGSTHYDLADRDQALDCLARRRKQFPNNEHRLVRETTTWTVEETDQ
ncbi:hypothetical protein [Streptomyces hydrogenans]|uniref:hypothetical protein n=1 Tax=Streptomyces hydrogenans TaxID=1873719 RepID=UPI0036E6160C